MATYCKGPAVRPGPCGPRRAVPRPDAVPRPFVAADDAEGPGAGSRAGSFAKWATLSTGPALWHGLRRQPYLEIGVDLIERQF